MPANVRRLMTEETCGAAPIGDDTTAPACMRVPSHREIVVDLERRVTREIVTREIVTREIVTREIVTGGPGNSPGTEATLGGSEGERGQEVDKQKRVMASAR